MDYSNTEFTEKHMSMIANGSVSLGTAAPVVPLGTETPVRIRIQVPDNDYREVLTFNAEESVWVAKQRVLNSVGKLQDGLNYGLYCPESNGRYGKFLDEERLLKDYPLPGPIALLEFKYKRREYKTQVNPAKLKKLHTQSNLKQFIECIKKFDVDGVIKWCNKGLDPNFHTQDKGETPMTVTATVSRPRSIMMALVSGGAFIDFRNRQGLTAMHVAANCGNRDAIRTLLDLGASPNYKDSQSLTPLYHCVMNASNAPQCTQMLLHDRADVGCRDSAGWTELHQACKNGLVQHLEHLLFYGTDINAVTSTNDTALHICARYDKEECARVLMFRGADRTLTNAAGETPYQIAVAAGHRVLADVMQKFRPEDVVLYHELPKYNDKRRGTISVATLRNLQRSRSNPQLHMLFQQDPSLSASLSPGTGQPFLTTATSHSGTPATVSGIAPTSRLRGSLMSSFSEKEARTVVIRRDTNGFGFILRGSKGRNGSAAAQTLDFKPSAEIPALQYFDTVSPSSAAEKAGLQNGDFLLEINGENVVNATHERCVQLMTTAGETLILKVTKSSIPRPSVTGRIDSQPRVNDATGSPSSTPNLRTQNRLSVNGLAELEKLDDTLNNHSVPSYTSVTETVPVAAVADVPVYATVGSRTSKTVESSATNNNHVTTVNVSSFPVVNGYSSKDDEEPPPDYEVASDTAVSNGRKYKFDAPDYDMARNGTAVNNTTGLNGNGYGLSDRGLYSEIGDSRVDSMVEVRTSPKKVAPSAPATFIAPPPPPPPLPDSFNTPIPLAPMMPLSLNIAAASLKPVQSTGLPRQSTGGMSPPGTLPPQVQRQLEETKKRDESHAALLAAVKRRRNLLESTDSDQVASSIESRVQRTSKLQIVYKAGTSSGEQRASPVSPTGLLAPPVTNATVKIGNGPTTTVAASLTSPTSPAAGNGYLAEAEKALQEYFVRSTTSSAASRPQQTTVASSVNHTPPVIKSSVTTDNTARRGGTFVVNAGNSSSTRVFSAAAATNATTAAAPVRAATTSPVVKSVSPVASSPASIAVSPSAASPVALIPPPAEFATEVVSAAATLRSVARPQSNSMVFRAAVRTNSAEVTTKTVVWPPKQYTDRKVETWSAEEVGEWLESLDLGIYRDAFNKHGVSGQMLANARDADLESYGIPVPLHRVKIERELRRLAK